MRTPHTSCRKGKRIRCVLKNGTVFIDKFVDKKANYVIFETEGKIEIGNIKNFSIYKGKVTK